MKLFTPVLVLLPFAFSSAQVPNSAISTPSRSAFLSGSAAQATYLKAMKGCIAINNQERDPFGLNQDTAKAAGPTLPPSAPSGPSLFSQVITELPITGIMAGSKQFLIGARVLSEGGAFPIRKDKELVRVRVARVNAESVDFVAVEGGEKATRSLAIAPNVGIPAGEPDRTVGVFAESDQEIILP
jgi:hypothetical protein